MGYLPKINYEIWASKSEDSMITDIVIRPTKGQFETAAIEARLEKIPHTARDPVEGIDYMIAYSDEALARALEERRNTPDEFSLSVILVSVVPQQIIIAYRAADPEPMRAFVNWLRERYDVSILDEEFNDLTEQCDADLTYLFGAVSPTE
jgi:hypothetical protein